MPPVRNTFPVTLTASTWGSLVEQLQTRATNARGTAGGVPQLTNAEALQVVRALSTAVGRAGFPLWYQFAAAAFGWDPTTDALDTSSTQAAGLYPVDDAVMLWAAVADAADAENSKDPADQHRPALYFDDAWTDPLYLSDVRRALQDDGATAAFKIPLPACKDPKTGKPVGKPRRGPDGKWRCDPVTVDDPVTFAGKQFRTLALLALGAWLLFGKKPRRRNRRS